MPRGTVSLATRQRRLTTALAELAELVHSELPASAQQDEALVAALTCTLPAVLQQGAVLNSCLPWLCQSSDEWTLQALDELQRFLASGLSDSLRAKVSAIATAAEGEESQLWNLYELLLSGRGDRARRSSGTFYTPPQITRFLVATVDRKLRQEFGFSQGLADPAVRLLEPACGSGEFILAVLELLAGRGRDSLAANDPRDAKFVHRQRIPTPELLARLTAIELSPAPLFITKLRIALALRAKGYELTSETPQPQLILGNALAGPDALPALSQPVNVVLGNPPFSYLSRNDQPWIRQLIRGEDGQTGYFAIDGQRLDEKKTWLHDDYVKFVRLAQWCIEQNGSGIVSLVTNHGWLDNATFRIARQQLLRTFDQIEIVDLHGNAKRHEAAPGSERDDNVFGIAQGIALATLTKSGRVAESKVTRCDLWGSRASKLERLSIGAVGEALPHLNIVPTKPWFAFTAESAAVPLQYQRAPLLTELMPVNSTVPVTARDHFVVARTRDELLKRIEQFCDPQLSDERVRELYFQRTRSSRYEPGDTRSWKLTEARRIVREAGDPQQFLRRCLYRPFVWRYVFWHPAMIDWPRPEVTRHLEPGNLALLARRQSIAGKECNYFWVTDCLPLDGVIRSDNRGSESFFPLWLDAGNDEQHANFSVAALDEGHFGESLFAYCYGLFHSREYRTRYAPGLAQEFPRVLFPIEAELFNHVSSYGTQLIGLHLTDPANPQSEISNLKFEISDLQSQIDSFHAGTYNVCRKWLQMENQTRESPAFARLQQLIAATIVIQDQVDQAIQRAGGFPAAFR